MDKESESQDLSSYRDRALGQAVSLTGEFGHMRARSAAVLIVTELFSCALEQIERAARAARAPGLILAGCSSHTAVTSSSISLRWL